MSFPDFVDKLFRTIQDHPDLDEDSKQCTFKVLAFDNANDKTRQILGHLVESNIQGPLGHNLCALLLGQSSTSRQGIFVVPGVIDAYYTGLVKIMVYTITPPVSILKGSRIAQLVPFLSEVLCKGERDRGNGGFGSTGAPQVYFAMDIMKRKSEVEVLIRSKWNETVTLKMMIDKGADVTIISQQHWPLTWPTISSPAGIVGPGGGQWVAKMLVNTLLTPSQQLQFHHKWQMLCENAAVIPRQNTDVLHECKHKCYSLLVLLYMQICRHGFKLKCYNFHKNWHIKLCKWCKILHKQPPSFTNIKQGGSRAIFKICLYSVITSYPDLSEEMKTKFFFDM